MSDMESSIGPRRSPMEILGMDWGWVRNECRPDWRIGDGYDSALPLGQALEAEIGVMEQTCLKREYGLMDGAISEASRVRQLSDLLIASGFGRRLKFFYKRLVPTRVAPCFFFPHLYHVQPDPGLFPYAGLAQHRGAQQAALDRQEEAGSGARSATLTPGGEGAAQVRGEGAEGVRGGGAEGGRGDRGRKGWRDSCSSPAAAASIGARCVRSLWQGQRGQRARGARGCTSHASECGGTRMKRRRRRR